MKENIICLLIYKANFKTIIIFKSGRSFTNTFLTMCTLQTCIRLEFVREVEGAAPKGVEVLIEVPKSPQMPRLKPTPTKESLKDKKGK